MISASQEEHILDYDREDLLALLQIRFGDLQPRIVEGIHGINRLETLQRLILVAANVPDLRFFIEELQAGDASFKLIGERFSPINEDRRSETD